MTDEIRFPDRRDDDAKAWFYLDHRRDIEAWIALRDDAAEVFHAHLLALEPAVQTMADSLGCEMETVDVPDGAWPRFGLWRPGWQTGGVRDLSVAIEWQRAALLVPGANCWPFVGVRSEGVEKDRQRWTELVAVLAPARAQLRAAKSRPWPLWRYEEPPTDADGVEPEAIALGLLSNLRQVWSVVAATLDAMHPAN